ncbi:protein dopey-1-like isoform X2 [Patiria miniata]|uniref:Uncharacterized protein n=1 Tax=Patiria miniata TaxID=46514 RepID=A0A913ZE87_PATMI|nr:protein dopey-1-like isoform X1 [Patiria miniata]XP_038049266.1 protein dopey-1-like isoform X2 [Patiria miniata]
MFSSAGILSSDVLAMGRESVNLDIRNVMNLDESELMSDPKFKAYAAAVDKALKGFEYSSEWADLISALAKLIKVLQSNSTRYSVIPKRLLIGKRLAQCTHPALPSGVHLKALETYDLIFRTIGPKQLCQDMFIYSAGLFPLLGSAAMAVKPKLLHLYEEHYLPLGEHLKPCLTGLLQGIMPGLEEGSEYFDRTNALLEQLCAGMVKSNFYSALWECVSTSPGVRLPAVSFVLSQLDRKASMKEQQHILGNNRITLVNAVCDSLYDSVVLVQRTILDLVLLCFPLHDFCVSRDEQTRIMTAALNVLLRRDMSLNRRLFSWLLGTNSRTAEPKLASKPAVERSDSILSAEEETSAYFEAHSKVMLVESLKFWLHTIPSGLNDDETKAAILKPYKLLISLLDKPELSMIIVEDVFIEVFRALYNRCTTASANDVWKGLISDSQESLLLSAPTRKLLTRSARPVELIKTANLLFGVFEPYFMWEFIAQRFDQCCQQTVMRGGMAPSIGDDSSALTCSEMCRLVDFLLDIVALETYLETTTEYLPNLLCKLTVSLSNYCQYLSLSEIKDTLRLCNKLLTKVQPSMVTSPNQWDTSTPQRLLAHVDIIEKGWEEVNGGSGGITGTDASPQQSSTPKQTTQTQSVINSSDGSQGISSGSGAVQDESPESERNDKTKQGKPSSSKKFPLSPRRSLDRLSSERLEDAELAALDDDFQIERVKRPTKMQSLDSPSKEETVEFRPSHRRTPSSVSLTTSLAESDQDGQPIFIMQACVQCYQAFFAKFVSSKILPEAEVVKKYLKKLNVKCNGTQEKRQPSGGEGMKGKRPQNLGDMPDKMMSEDGRLRTNSALTTDEAVAAFLRDVDLQCTSSPSALQAFSTACHLLVEFACFPMYCNETASAAHIVTPTTTGSALGLPDWLQTLVACSCYVNNFILQTTAISTTLELIALTKSVTDRSDSKLVLPNPPNSPKTDSGTISVVLIPAVSASHLHTINFGTSFFQRVATSLWHHMSASTPNCHQKSADLLHQLHNVAPDVYICEDIIGNSLVQTNKAVSLAAHIKYAQLWHLIRSQILSASPASKVLTFDRSLLVMMDSLECPDCMIRSVTQTWLVHAIDRGDIARLLEPILLVLLHPATARVSVQFLHTKPDQKSLGDGKTDEAGGEDVENRIYSISSVDGEVKYYVIKDGKRAIAINPSKQDPVFACTTIDDKMKYVTNKANTGLRYSVPPQMLSKTLSVTVNPMNQSAYISDTDSDVSASPKTKANSSRKPSKDDSADKRKNRRVPGERRPSDLSNLTETLAGKVTPSTSTDDLCEEPSYVYNEDVDESPEDAVRSILMSLVEEAMRQVDGVGQDSDSRAAEKLIVPAGNKQSYVVTSASPRSKAAVRSGNLDNMSPEDYILDDLENAMSGLETEPSDVEMAEAATEDRSPQGQTKMLPALKLNAVPPLQQHILLYVQVYDAQRMLYVLSTIKAILSTNPWPFVCAMSSTSISSTNTPQLIKLQQLLARHKRCITGQDFYSDLEQEALTVFRSSTYLEIVVLICVYYMRSYYPRDLKASENDVHGNRDVQIASMEVLRLILHELVYIVKDSGRGLATFISDLLIRSKVQKAVLYCLLSSVFNSHHRGKNQSTEPEIILDISQDMSDRGAQAFQIQLLKLARTLIFLEDQLFTLKDDTDTGSSADSEWEYLRMKFTPQKASSVGFVRSERFGSQSIFITAVLSALKQYQICHMHRHWVSVVTEALPHLERGLPKLALPVCNQLCKNLEQLTILYTPGDSAKKLEVNLENVPPDHVVTMLEGLTTICHFCLLESTSNLSAMGSRHSGPVTSSTSTLDSESSTSTPLLSSLLGALTRDKSKSTSNPSSGQSNSPKAEARKGLLGMLPRIVSSVAKLWAVVLRCERLRDSISKPEEPPSWSFGPPKLSTEGTRQQILELLSPIALHHPVNLMAAIGVVWSDWKKKSATKQCTVVPQACEDQVVLVELVSAIRAMPTDTLMQTIKQVLKAPPFTIRDKDQPGLETSMLQFVYCYIGRMSVMSVRDSWQSLLSLLKEGLQLGLAPPGQFLLLRILNEIVHKIPAFEDRKDQKELQEVTQRLVEACNTIAGSSLEQSTWLRRNVSVKISPQEQNISQTDAVETAGGDSASEMTSVTPTDPSTPSGTPTKNYSQYSVQALNLLAELLATLLDMVYGSDEKEKVVPLLTSIMHNVTPYLKNHSSPNTPSFRACTALLSSLSGYQYTRKSWKKDAFDLLLDPSFFQLDIVSIHNWLPVIDNLMTHDKTTYRDLMARVAAFQNTSLNLFTSKEAEIDQRSQLLKRLSFTIFCSETDQYVRFLPDIQERLAESLRQSQGPAVHEQVFVCFRVLLLRISPHHLTGLWPTVISELVQVFLHMEEQLSSSAPDNTKKSVIKRVASTDFASFFLGGNGNTPQTLSNVAKPWLGLYLAACKLLDLAICLPSEDLPQFQVYKWAFVGGGKRKDSPMQFVPHVSRAAQLLRTRYKQENNDEMPALKPTPGRPLLTMYQIRSIEELLPFFNTVCPDVDTSLANQTPDLITLDKEAKTVSSGRAWKIEDLVDVEDLPPMEFIQKLMERDFLVPHASS